MRQGSLLFSKASGEEFETGIYDETGHPQLHALKEMLSRDAERFGIFGNAALPQ
jgi:hypothetical protein